MPDPVADHQFLLSSVLRVDERPWLAGIPAPETRALLLEEAHNLLGEVVAPLRLQSDVEGVRLHNGQVSTPPGFAQAYRQIREAGLHAPTLPEDLGGVGLSPLFAQFIEEMSAGACLALHMYFGFSTSAPRTITKFGAKDLVDCVVPPLVSGEWLATMCLTEPQAGSDLAQVRTLARPSGDGGWRISGEKIFITGGDSDLADNIIHIVLARIADGDGQTRSGIGGLGVFVVPRNHLDDGRANGVSVTGIEHKMGLNGGATCSLSFDDAQGYALASGATGSAAGMAPLFDMMNHARLATAVASVGVAATAAQMATFYAAERRAGRAAGIAPETGYAAHSIDRHPDVERMIASAWAFVEGARALLAWTALQMEEAACHPEEASRRDAAGIAHLLTPMLKAYVTDAAQAICDDCLQVFGGYGFVRETGVEQLLRDIRAGRIYEGANGIQAQDFVMRRMAGPGAAAVDGVVAQMRDFMTEQADNPHLAGVLFPLQEALEALVCGVRAATAVREADARALLSVSLDVVHLFGIVLIGWRSAVSVVAACDSAPELLARKQLLARHWARRHLPHAIGLARSIVWGTERAAG